MTTKQINQLKYDWSFSSREEQFDPSRRIEPKDYTWWILLAGRGFGKTRSGAEWLRQQIFDEGKKVVACIGPTAKEVRKVMVEGGGIMAVCPKWQEPVYNKSSTIQTLTWHNGAVCHLFAAENPDRIRGYNLEAVWMDELAAWSPHTFEECLMNIRLANRIGKSPKFCVTTTPKPHASFIKFYREMKELEDVGKAVITKGSTFNNSANLNETSLFEMRKQYFDESGAPTRIGRQELMGDVLMDLDQSMWTQEMLDKCQHRSDQKPKNLKKVVVSVDPSGSKKGDEVGIIVFGIDDNKVGWLLDDLSGHYSPKEWGLIAVKAWADYEADYIVGETNYGGDIVRENIHNIDHTVRFKPVHATRGKEVRAIPVASIYERGGIKHLVGNTTKKYQELENQMLLMTFDGYTGDGSPDRLDALVWAVNETMLKRATVTGVTALY